jgi:ATP-dependent protease ClpP protease subunit
MIRTWYRFQQKAEDPTVAELLIFDDIGKSWWDDQTVTAKQFTTDLAALPSAVTTIVVRVNSLGGDVFDAVAIANALRDQSRTKNRRVETVVEGIAASAASIVIMAGDVIRVADNALVMVHNPWTIEIGNAEQMRKTADALDKVRGQIVATYRWVSPLSEAEIVALMDAETWMDADEAIANGFATDKVEGLKAAASIDRRALAAVTVPEQYRDRVAGFVQQEQTAPVAAAAIEILQACREGDCPELAEELVAAKATLDQVRAKVTAAKEAKATAQARREAITALCTRAKQPELVEGYLASGLSPEDVGRHLTIITAKLDRVEIDGSLLPDAKRRSSSSADLSAAAIYADRNRTSKKE